MKYAVNEEGIHALNTMASAISDSVETLRSLVSTVQSTADEHNEALGPHKGSLDQVLEDINNAIQQASEPANSISETLIDVADGYQEVIDNDRFASSGN